MKFNDGDVVPYERLLQPRVEAEVAFVLKDDLVEGPLDIAQCRAAVAFAVPALEIVDSRISDWDISFGDTVADNASSGLFVLGRDRKSLDEFEPADVLMGLRVDGDLVASGDGRECLGDPLNALSWLARRAREFGDPLLGGQVVLSGALGKLSAVHAGARSKRSSSPWAASPSTSLKALRRDAASLRAQGPLAHEAAAGRSAERILPLARGVTSRGPILDDRAPTVVDGPLERRRLRVVRGRSPTP